MDTHKPKGMPASTGRLDSYADEITAFAATLNRDPSDPDLRWLFLNQRLLSLAQRRHWGLYRNTRMDMAAVLQREGRLQDALRTFLEVCYLDLNGPRNTGARADPVSPEESPGFSVELGLLAPTIVGQVHDLTEQLKLSEADVQREFFEISSRVHKDLKLPMAPKQAWERVQSDLADK